MTSTHPEDPAETARWEAEKRSDLLPIPAGPFLWVLTLAEDGDYEATAKSYQSLQDGLPEDVRDRSRAVLLAHGYTLQALDDDDLARLGLRRIEAP